MGNSGSKLTVNLAPPRGPTGDPYNNPPILRPADQRADPGANEENPSDD
jgi:hypothetical protein